MRISEAERRYVESGFDAIAKDYRDLVETFRKLEIHEAIPNANYIHALYLNDLMFRSTTHHIRMLAGIGESNWLGILRDTLIKTLTRMKSKGGNFRAIFLGEASIPDIIFKLRDRFGEATVQFVKAQVSQPVRHFVTCDSRMLRLEDIHGPITRETEASAIKATVYLNNPPRAKTLEQQFDAIWSYLEQQD